jgi:hypothetical protein
MGVFGHIQRVLKGHFPFEFMKLRLSVERGDAGLENPRRIA